MANAPVCHVSSDQVIPQPAQRLIPTIGKATDLKSALQVIAQLTLVVNILSGQQRTGTSGSAGGTSTGTTAGGVKSSKPPPPKPGDPDEGRWVENRQGRVTEKVRIEQEDNSENWVEFERINRVVYVDSKTGEQWSWVRGKSS